MRCKYKFLIILSPTGPYYAAPMRIYVEENYTRAAVGGIGYVKAAGNYGASMHPTAEARRKGYDQVLWTDGLENKYIEESGMMNVMFVINDTLVTPPLSDSILDGITRDSLLRIARDLAYKVEERRVSIDELEDAFKKGTITEAFGAGTAAVVAPIGTIGINGVDHQLPGYTKTSISARLKLKIERVRTGKDEDKFGWNFLI